MPCTEDHPEDIAADIMAEARRALEICNACQYCNGYCAVFRTLKARRQVGTADLLFLANLCHNCRSCYHACQYAPPHAFGVNLPKSLSLVRQRSYRDHAWPPLLRRRLRYTGRAVVIATLLAVEVLTLAAILAVPAGTLLGRHSGPGAFYRVVPWEVMAGVAGIVMLWSLLAIALSVAAFWRGMGPAPAGVSLPAALRDTVLDVLTLRNLGGGGAGCYGREGGREGGLSQTRRRFHHALFYSVALCFASTAVATLYDHLFGWQAPYPVLSLPVLLGSLGGGGIMAGTAGLALLKRRADPVPVAASVTGGDRAFLLVLFLAAASGLALLALRGTAAMGPLLLTHLGIVLGVFATLPYGKFLHAPFRVAALLRAAMERNAGSRTRPPA
ncbi:tricarballylate utilization 4Fe-4S protein TcuB [Azospirillum picis]|uniref:Citrate/tricarballylate utilization protein n=1 Tax=Azospirillum picis TaxID=488438 RepID=A0ABU0MJ29_9PROT|nr:tricarballylate utilization 4Fe-4S protein TcuB [Azospirillum picis]MBP2299445.1 citrate/tricarballylate utilization protein [Azospirillum picis]MDQ0533428.1 citrate/tricarballylate utilization protein [Azospirillum picis]